MKTTKRFILMLAAILGMTGAWAQDAEEVAVTQASATEWQLTMPASDVELQIEYYTDEEIYSEGVELTDNGDGTWTLSSMPAFDIELQVSYDDETTAIISITDGKVDRVTYYDLQGRRVRKPTRGVFIIGGKKVVIK